MTYYCSLLRPKAAQPLEIQHTINKTVKKEEKLVRKSGKTVKLSIQCTCLLIVIIIIVYYASKAAK